MAEMQGDSISIEEIAKALGVSKTTVSRALSGKGRISEATRSRVRAYVASTGAAPTVRARWTEKTATHNLTMIIPPHFVHLDLPFLRKCMGGISMMAAQRGYDLLLCYASASDTSQLERQLSNRKTDGVILSRAMEDDPCLDLLQQYHVPYVVIGRCEDTSIPQVDNDQVGASYEMTRLLLRLGARRIALIVGTTTYTVNIDRMRGYMRALPEFGVAQDRRLIQDGVESAAQRSDALEAVLDHHPDCLLCGDDRLAFDVMQALHARHIRVPQDLQVASLYDSELLLNTVPNVSAVQFDAERLGASACRMLLDILAGKQINTRQVEGYQVILRDSTH